MMKKYKPVHDNDDAIIIDIDPASEYENPDGDNDAN